MRLVSEPTPQQLRTYSSNIQDALKAMKAKAESGLNPAVDMVTVTTGCNHGCKFCFANSVSRAKGQDITIETLNKASAKVRVTSQLALTGGEPLDHPHIANIALVSPDIRIPFTNGFSIPVTNREYAVLSQIASRIDAISFNIHDNRNSGRDAVLTFFLFCGHTPLIQFLVEPGKEKELVSAWADLLLRLLKTPAIQTFFGNPKVSEAFYGLFGVYPMIAGDFRAIYRSGRGLNLQGADLEPLSFNSFSVRDGLLRSLDFTQLLPDGRLAPSFLTCHQMRAPDTQVFAHIDDSIESIRARHREAILGYLSGRLDRSEAEFQKEVLAHFECLDVRLGVGVDVIMALIDPAIKAKFKEIKERMAALLGIPANRFTTMVDVDDPVIIRATQDLAESSKKDGLYYIDDPFQGGKQCIS